MAPPTLAVRLLHSSTVEQVVMKGSGQSYTVPLPAQLPDGWRMVKVLGAPVTATADACFETLGTGLDLLVLTRREGALA